MKYSQPYGLSDPDAAYTNGNPSTGTMGSIPPATSIEHPQREIVNLINSTGQAPSDTDLFQLARGVQSNQMNFAQDIGTVNQVQITCTPPLLDYRAGQRFSIRIANTNTSAATLNVSGLGPRPIHYPNAVPLGGGEMQADTIVSLIYDGIGWQMQNIAANLLAAPLAYYIDAALGDDNAFDGSSAAVSGNKGPFRTVQKGIDQAIEWNQNGFGVGINIADGSYPPFVTRTLNGSGGITIKGNMLNPAGVLIHATAGEAIINGAEGGYYICGLKVQSDGPGATGHGSHGFRVAASQLSLGNIDFGVCKDAHVMCDSGAVIGWPGQDIGLFDRFYQVSGDSPMHFYVPANAYMYLGLLELRIPAVRNIGVWATVHGNSTMHGAYSTINGGVNVIGSKFNVFQNGVILTGQGINYFPGNLAGTISSGGQVS